MPSHKSEKNRIDSSWFKGKIKERGLTHRVIAKKLGYSNHTVVSHILTGRRRLDSIEVHGWADILGVPVSQIVLHSFGIPSDTADQIEQYTDKGSILVKGVVDGNFNVSWGTPATGPQSIPNPLDAVEADGTSREILAFHCRTMGTKYEVYDGAFLVCRRSQDVSPDAIGRLCLVSVRGGTDRIRVVKRGYQPGRYNLAMINLEPAEEGVELTAAAPIVWIKI